MKLPYLIITAALILCLSTQAWAGHVFLKNGAIINGKIIQESDTGITIKSGSKEKTFSRNTIIRVLYRNFRGAKSLVRLNDGNEFLAFKVFEDQTSYTFRKKLNSPQEFKVKREKVQFLTAMYPSALRAYSCDEYTELQWSPPFRQAKSYRIYMAEGKGEFRLYREESDITCLIPGLTKGKTYRFRVTAVEKSGRESVPGNIVKITAGKGPAPPVSPEAEWNIEGKNLSAEITWNPPREGEGEIKGYRVYRIKKRGPVQIGETEGAGYTVSALDPYKDHRLFVRAVDKSGKASVRSSIVTYRRRLPTALNVIIQGAYFRPLGDFGEITAPGPGVLGEVYLNNLFINGLFAGISFGYFALLDNENAEGTGKGYMVPLMAKTGYSFTFFDTVRIFPYISGGAAWTQIEYDPDGYNIYDGPEFEKKQGIEPVGTAGLDIRFSFFEGLYFEAGGRFGLIRSGDRMMNFMMFTAGAGHAF